MTYTPWDMLLLSDPNQFSNFQSFLDSVTPKIRTSILNGTEKETTESFSLSRLWDFYTEGSYFGNGVPILLKNGDGIVQYYCPTLSGLQIYTRKPPTSFGKGSALKQDSNSWSDESENDELSNFLSNNSSKSSELTSDDSEHDALFKASNPFGDLYCEFNEMLSPYQRVPFAQKIKQLAQQYPDFLKFQSSDLSPYSWMAVAWYPIYQIPLTKNEKALSACFVTYHALSTLNGVPEVKGEGEKRPSETVKENAGFNEIGEIGMGKIAIPPFAVITYKMNGELWKNPMTSDEEKIASSLNAASSWLKLLNFHHHDFNFFMSRRSFR